MNKYPLTSVDKIDIVVDELNVGHELLQSLVLVMVDSHLNVVEVHGLV